MAVRTLTVKQWAHTCGKCGEAFDVEEEAAASIDGPLTEYMENDLRLIQKNG